jgi:hypothetical protein
MKKITGMLLCLMLLGYGLVRIGVGGALLAQELAWIHFPELADALAEMKVFFDARVGQQLLPFNMAVYNGYILAMGLVLTAGAVGVMYYQRWGFLVLGVYLMMHAALFINFQEFSLNKKLLGLALQCLILMVLVHLRAPRNTQRLA